MQLIKYPEKWPLRGILKYRFLILQVILWELCALVYMVSCLEHWKVDISNTTDFHNMKMTNTIETLTMHALGKFPTMNNLWASGNFCKHWLLRWVRKSIFYSFGLEERKKLSINLLLDIFHTQCLWLYCNEEVYHEVQQKLFIATLWVRCVSATRSSLFIGRTCCNKVHWKNRVFSSIYNLPRYFFSGSLMEW